MDLDKATCPEPACPFYGQSGQGNIGLHSKKENRLRCRKCHRTFAATTGTVFYRRRHDEATITRVVTLLAHGCPPQAVCHAFGLDERTVAAWHRAAGRHCEGLHGGRISAERLVTEHPMDLQQVQADEIRVKAQGRVVWMALALCVTSRLWLGGVVSTRRDTAMTRALALKVRACALCRPLLICFDGFPAYVDAFAKAFRSPLHTGRRGRPRLVRWARVVFGRVTKSRRGRRLDTIKREVLMPGKTLVVPAGVETIDEAALAEDLRQASQGGSGVINTAYIERFNATMRSMLSSLARRTRSLARCPETLACGMHLAGCVYNFCLEHRSLAVELWVVGRYGERRRWIGKTPAMAAGLTDHRWSVGDLLNCRLRAISPTPRLSA
jgi:transposase-like protein